MGREMAQAVSLFTNHRRDLFGSFSFRYFVFLLHSLSLSFSPALVLCVKTLPSFGSRGAGRAEPTVAKAEAVVAYSRGLHIHSSGLAPFEQHFPQCLCTNSCLACVREPVCFIHVGNSTTDESGR